MASGSNGPHESISGHAVGVATVVIPRFAAFTLCVSQAGPLPKLRTVTSIVRRRWWVPISSLI